MEAVYMNLEEDAQTRIDHLLKQLGKLSKITQLVSEGHFFLYHPNADCPEEDDPINVLAENFNFMIKKLREAQENLENKVQLRTNQLQEKTQELEKLFREVSELKNEQDGDYYLTSLLLEPLCSNRAVNSTVSIEFLVKQKKKFSFNGKSKTIGGDICGADTVQLRGREYTAFANADAMGKSIQGAAGALILGSLFDAIIKRTKLSEISQQKFPELWVRESFIEFQKVFESFDGGMMVSMLIGLIDNENGTMYCINADYPPIVLFRNGAAKFLATNHFLKVGIRPDFFSGKNYKPLAVDIFELQDGDILVSGSDGRDDLLIETAEGKYINNDENLFLRITESEDADLNAIFEALSRTGRVTDDLSLMRAGISLPGRRRRLNTEQKKLCKQFETLNGTSDLMARTSHLEKMIATGIDHRVVFRMLVKCYYRLRDFPNALEHAEQFCANYPAETRMIYILANLYFLLGDLPRAAVAADRLLSREPATAEYAQFQARVQQKLAEGAGESKNPLPRAQTGT